MIEQRVRPIIQSLIVDSIAKAIGSKISPNTITFLSFFCGLLSAVVLFINIYVSIILLLLSGYFDILDGSVAHLQSRSSSFGTMLDILSDRFVESFIIIAIFVNQPDIAWVGLIMMMSILVCVSSFLLVGIFSEQDSQKSFYYSPGLIERAETFVVFIVMMLFSKFVLLLGIVYTLLVLWTTFYRCYEFYMFEKNKE